MHKVYKDDGADEIDHSIWWLCFIVSWVEITTFRKGNLKEELENVSIKKI